MNSAEILYSIALRHCPGIGDYSFRRLVGHFGSAENVWQTRRRELMAIPGIGDKTVQDIGLPVHLEFARREMDFCEKHGIAVLVRHGKHYPAMLAEAEDAPAILYIRGNLPEASSWLSIVGTRNATSYGKNFIADLLQQIPAKDRLCTVSGLALGTDAEAHLQSLKNNIRTVGVLAHGFHTFYPSKNKKLSEEMLAGGGALITEFNSTQKPDRENFIQRNRIVAALSPATVVVETAYGGGSISTANFALNYNREVYALPGRIWDKYSQGCNALIAQNKAAPIVSVSQLIDELNLNPGPAATGSLFLPAETRPPLTDSQQLILEKLKNKSGLTLDDLALEMQMPGYALLGDLLEMELNEWVQCSSGKQYSLR